MRRIIIKYEPLTQWYWAVPEDREHVAKRNLYLLPGKEQLASEEIRPGEEPNKFYRRRHFLALDGLRGVAVLLVVLAHASQRQLLAENFKFSGELGVMVFFVLSGFLITHLLLEERSMTGQISLIRFYVRRTLRIWPLYFAVLGVYVFVLPLFLDPENFRSIYEADSLRDHYYLLAYPLFLQNYLLSGDDFHYSGLRVFWSLAVEEHFYLFWPLLLVALRGRWLVPSLVGLMIATFGLRALTLLEVLPHTGVPVDHMTHTALDGLAAGCLVACCYHSWPGVLKALARRRWFYLLGWALLLFLVWAALKDLPFFPTLPEEEYYGIMLAALASAVIVACVVGGAGLTHPILCFRPLAYVGKVSYGVYLLHPIVLICAFKAAKYLGLLHGAGYFVATVAYLAIVIGVAGLSFKFFEAPILRFKERFARV
jgi:peptidoglycan/LPS O-acetylase OafA/YrhL